jgi:hypothetical protein
MSLLVCVLMASAFGQCSIDHRLLTTSDALSSFHRPVILHKMVSATTKAYFCQTAVFPHGEHSYMVLLVGGAHGL